MIGQTSALTGDHDLIIPGTRPPVDGVPSIAERSSASGMAFTGPEHPGAPNWVSLCEYYPFQYWNRSEVEPGDFARSLRPRPSSSSMRRCAIRLAPARTILSRSKLHPAIRPSGACSSHTL